MGAGIASLLWLVTQFCIINRPIPGEHLGESIKEIKAIINPPAFSIDLYIKYIYLNRLILECEI